MRRRVLFGFSLLAVMIVACVPILSQVSLETLKLPDGFRATVYASGFQKARFMAFAPKGDLFLSDTGAGKMMVLTDRDKNGKLDDKLVFAEGLRQPHGLAFHNGFLYVANTDAVVRFQYKPGDLKASSAPEKLADLPSGGGHSTRTVVFGSDGRMYVSIGSTCNVCEESDPRRAAVWVFDADGKNGKPFALGLRNAVGIEWYQGKLYATNNGRDLLGDDTPPESFFVLENGKHYGWPYCYTVANKAVWDRDYGKRDQAFCDSTVPAFATTTAHSAPLGLAFYTGTQFPEAYRGLMFVALHGSWNRTKKSGYKVITINPKTGETKDFMTGWLQNESVSGRPVDLEVAPDGALMLSDDGANLVYRITYQR